MDKSLLIHCDNTPLIMKITNSIKFNPSVEELNNSDIDTYISQQLIPKIERKDFNIIFIKDSLSNNYLELYGITVAYHIRLSIELGRKRFIPIVIISDIDGYILNKLSPMAKILFTKNIFITKNDILSYENFENFFVKIKPFDDFKKDFLDLIHIKEPEDYLSHHSISNEWSIYRWAEFLNVDTNPIRINRTKIENMLYFKYLKAKNPTTKKTGLSIVPKTPQSGGDILYIDDEYDKGWSDIFDKYFSKSININYHFLKHQYTGTDYEKIETSVKEILISKSIDTILLDMRLTKEDHIQKEVKELSGIKLLAFIKSFNPGIQVILLTASEKSTLLDESNKHNILGYIKKEKPSDSSTYTKEVFKKLTAFIDLGFEKKYLKEIWNIQEKILKLNFFNKEQHQNIKIEIKSIFEILQTNMENKFIYAMFALFKIIEIIIALYIEEKKENKKRFAYWKNTNIKIKLIGKNEYLLKELELNSNKPNDSTLNKIRNLCYEKIQLNSKDVHNSLIELVNVRNETIHPSKIITLEKPTEYNILRWFIVVKMIIERINPTKN